MNQLELLQSISKYFARFSEQVKILNANNEFHINIHAENLLVKVLNIVYDLRLRNLNPSNSGRYAAIDLLDDEPTKKIAFQVTSTNTIDKVKDCIQKFFRNGVYKSVKSLNIYVLTNKQNSYSKESIQRKIDEEIDVLIKQRVIEKSTDIDFQFDPNVNILDKTNLYKKLNEDNDLDIIILLERVIRQQYGMIEEKEELSGYYRTLKNMFYDTVMDDENGMTLDQIYTEPSFSIHRSAFRKDDKRFVNESNQKFYNADSRYKIHEFVDDLISGNNALSLSSTYRLILILGYPGQGKSSFCKKFLNDYILNKKEEKKPVYYFSLRNIRQAKDFIYSPFSILYEEACINTGQNLNKFEFNKAIYVLDGLDELYMRENLKLEEIDTLCIELVRLIEKSPELTILITSRYGYVDDVKLNKENILIAQLSSFTFELQTAWLSRYLKFHPDTWLSNDKLKMLNTEPRYTHITELIEQPLLLHMVASMKYEIDEHSNRAKIYSQLFNELIDRKYAKEGQIEILKNIEKSNLRELIRDISFSIFQSGNEYINKAELLRLPSTQSFLKLLRGLNVRDSIKGIMISFYFKETERDRSNDEGEDKSNYAIEFLHKSLKEYMVAEKIFYTIKERFLDKRTNGKYIIDDFKSALAVLIEVFGPQYLYSELRIHLKEIIDNSLDNQEKADLGGRISLYLEEYLRTDFLIEYRVDRDKYPIDISLRCFYGFWYFNSCLGLTVNYLTTPTIKNRFGLYLKYISNSEEYLMHDLDFSYQDFSGFNMTMMEFYGSTFNETNFSHCHLKAVVFDGCQLINVNANRASLEQVKFSESLVNTSTFKNAYLESVNITDTRFEKVDFSESTIYDLTVEEQLENRTIIYDCTFKQVEIDDISIYSLKKFVSGIESEIKSEYGSEIEYENDEYIFEENENSYFPRESEIPADYKRIDFRDDFPF